ncbi:tryptophanase [Myxococcus stipitatus DSM 14675]|uniref:Tryptophanase n=1 Tax=Myxococcus stipitatus (strain DSM 14675 / JCM 12634 / Mx s8) TaxID=1278073 RepID=L7U715_MYXSD|nr:tryptophanase [Myxococcus stipitatus]AGC42279.1 tryptophanase [Myxococcus stipitatus DSM 14675]
MKPRLMPEPFRSKMIEPLSLPCRSTREAVLKTSQYNMFQLKSRDVYLDLLTDSGTGAMSKEQWAAMMNGDEAYAGANSFFNLKKAVQELLGFDHVIPTHQGRGAEHVVFGSLAQPGDVIPMNMPFDTTRAHIFHAGARPLSCVVDEAFQPGLDAPFKGNVDLGKLELVLAQHPRQRIPLIMVTVTNNSGGGQPVSLENLQACARMARARGIPLFLDAARMAENAWFIQQREPSCKDLSCAQILRRMMDCADAITVSCKKDALVNIGGLVATRTEALYYQLAPRTILFEGYLSYGGLAGRDLEALACGLREMVDEEYLAHRVAQVGYLGDQLSEVGVPVLRPVGGHAVFIDASAFLPHIPRRYYPADVLSIEVYREGAIRGVGLGALAFEETDLSTGEKIPPQLELYRLAVPRRAYSNHHMDYVAQMVAAVYQRRNSIRYGLKLARESPVPGLAHFVAQLEPVEL